MASPMTHAEWVARWRERHTDQPTTMPLSPTRIVVTEKDLLKEEIACLRLLKAIAEQERDDAQADAAAYRAERDAVNEANRRLRLKANEDATFLRAARHIGKETEKELAELRALIQAMRGWENASTDTEIELRSRIDVYQCEVEGLKAVLASLGIEAGPYA